MQRTWLYGLVALVAGIVVAWAWVFWLSPSSVTPPEDFASDILVQEIMSVQGNETTVTVYRDGRLVYAPSMLVATSTEPQTYQLTAAELAELTEAIRAAGDEVRRFEREPGVLYEGTYRLRTNLNEYREHSTVDAALAEIPAVWEPYLE